MPFFQLIVRICFCDPSGDDQYMLTAARGGPGAFQITGWLQIEGLKKSHEGDYTCVAKNSESKDYAKARIKVVDGSLVGQGHILFDVVGGGGELLGSLSAHL